MKDIKKLSAYTLQIIAVVAMFIDHTAHIIVNMSFPGSVHTAVVMNCIGRITMPIMCFFVAEGYHKTSNLQKYMLRLLTFTIISQIPYYLFGISSMPQDFWAFVKGNIHRMNVGVTLLMGLVALTAVKSEKLNVITKIAVAAAATYLTRFRDWRYYGVLWILVFGLFRDDFAKQTVFFILIAAIRCWRYYSSPLGLIINSCVILALPLLFLYSGEKGKKPKYGFYIFYPAHLLVYGIIIMLMNT